MAIPDHEMAGHVRAILRDIGREILRLPIPRQRVLAERLFVILGGLQTEWQANHAKDLQKFEAMLEGVFGPRPNRRS